jgi:hypothetical protein
VFYVGVFCSIAMAFGDQLGIGDWGPSRMFDIEMHHKHNSNGTTVLKLACSIKFH